MAARDNGTESFDASFSAGPADEASIDSRERKVRRDFWSKFRRVAGHIPFADDLVAAYYCALDVNTPLRVRGTLLGALAYFILPIDMVPDFIAGFGFTDDAAVLAAAISMVSAHITPSHRAAAATALGKDMPDGRDSGVA